MGGDNMTQNQVAYYGARETQRHNLETERQGRDTIKETSRHNQATEGIESGKLSETSRHNVASEGIQSRANALGYAQLAETARHNKSIEGINWYSAQGLVNLQNAQASLASSNVGQQAEANRIEGIRANSYVNKNNWDIMNQNEANGIMSRNATTNTRNAATNERNAATNEYNAQTNKEAVWGKITNDSIRNGIEAARTILQGGN